MEEYEIKRKYLFHLKKISEIRLKKPEREINSAEQSPRNSSRVATKFKERPVNLLLSNRKSKILQPSSSTMTTRPHQSSEQIMSQFLKDKENTRLVTRIMKIGSNINMQKYAKQYEYNKKLMEIHSKVKRSEKSYLKVLIFDITFTNTVSSLDDTYSIYLVNKGKNMKKLLIQGNLFEIRKRHLHIPEMKSLTFKIEGKHQGIIQINQFERKIVEISRHKHKVGQAIIEIETK